MYDRQLLYAGKPQKYGTQMVQESPDSNKMVLWELADPRNVNALRKEMGLQPLDGYFNNIDSPEP